MASRLMWKKMCVKEEKTLVGLDHGFHFFRGQVAFSIAVLLMSPMRAWPLLSSSGSSLPSRARRKESGSKKASILQTFNGSIVLQRLNRKSQTILPVQKMVNIIETVQLLEKVVIRKDLDFANLKVVVHFHSTQAKHLHDFTVTFNFTKYQL